MAQGSDFHLPHFGRERLSPGLSLARHWHGDGYITVVLGGSYQEAGFDGRRNLIAGDVVVHRRYDAHLDHIGADGAELINLPLPPEIALPAAFRAEDPDALARLAERSPLEAALQLRPSGEVAAQ